MSVTSTETRTAVPAISVKPTPTWTALPIIGDIPPPFEIPDFGLIVTPLHPTFGCQLEGVNWEKPISPELYAKIRELADKVSVLKCAERH
jgi:hypothetical protein